MYWSDFLVDQGFKKLIGLWEAFCYKLTLACDKPQMLEWTTQKRRLMKHRSSSDVTSRNSKICNFVALLFNFLLSCSCSGGTQISKYWFNGGCQRIPGTSDTDYRIGSNQLTMPCAAPHFAQGVRREFIRIVVYWVAKYDSATKFWGRLIKRFVSARDSLPSSQWQNMEMRQISFKVKLTLLPRFTDTDIWALRYEGKSSAAIENCTDLGALRQACHTTSAKRSPKKRNFTCCAWRLRSWKPSSKLLQVKQQFARRLWHFVQQRHPSMQKRKHAKMI